MSNHVSHAALPYPIKNARFSLLVPFLDADGDPVDPTTPDTEFSTDNATFADCAEEVTTTAGTNGIGYITLTGAETNASMVAIAAKVASGPKNTLATLYPRVLAIVGSGTLSAGSAGGGTLGTLLPYDVTGCFIRSTGGTGGGGTGGANNQARKIITYNVSTGAFTVAPNWETTPDNTTTYDVLLPDGVTLGMLKALNPATAGRTVDIDSSGRVLLQPTQSGVTIPTVTTLTNDPTGVGTLLTRMGTPSNLGGGATLAGNLSDIEGQTDDIGAAGAGLTAADDAILVAIAALNNLSSAQAQTAAAAALTAYDPPTNAELVAEIDAVQALLPAALTTNGNLKVSLVEVLTTALTETSTGLLAAAFKKFFDKATPTGTINSIPDAVAGATNGIAIVGSAMGLAANAVDSAAMASSADDEIAAAILDLANGVESGVTVRKVLRLLAAALGGKATGLDIGTPTYRNIGDTKTVVTAVTDADGNRSSVTLDLT